MTNNGDSPSSPLPIPLYALKIIFSEPLNCFSLHRSTPLPLPLYAPQDYPEVVHQREMVQEKGEPTRRALAAGRSIASLESRSKILTRTQLLTHVESNCPQPCDADICVPRAGPRCWKLAIGTKLISSSFSVRASARRSPSHTSVLLTITTGSGEYN